VKLIRFFSFLVAIAISVSIFVVIPTLVTAAVPSLLRFAFDHTTLFLVAPTLLLPVTVFLLIRAQKLIRAKKSGS